MGISSSKSTVSPSGFSKPFISGAANNLQSTVAANAPQLAQNAGLINDRLPGLADRAFGEDPNIGAAQGYNKDVLGGKYLTGNPYLDQMIGQTNNSVVDRINSIFGQAGRTGGGQHEGVLGRELANSESRLRYSDYDAERARMGQAAGQTPGLTAASFAGIEPFLAATTSGSSLPYLGANTLAQGIQGLVGPYATTKTSPGLGQMLLAAAQSAAQAAYPGGV